MEEEIKRILTNSKVIAVVGLSADEDKPSYRVAAYMQTYGYRIIPVNPFVEEILGEKSYKSLRDMPPEIQKTVDIVDIFRRSDAVPAVVDEALELKRMHGKPTIIWMQLGIVNKEAAVKAQTAGFVVVMDRCVMVEYRRVFNR